MSLIWLGLGCGLWRSGLGCCVSGILDLGWRVRCRIGLYLRHRRVAFCSGFRFRFRRFGRGVFLGFRLGKHGRSDHDHGDPVGFDGIGPHAFGCAKPGLAQKGLLAWDGSESDGIEFVLAREAGRLFKRFACDGGHMGGTPLGRDIKHQLRHGIRCGPFQGRTHDFTARIAFEIAGFHAEIADLVVGQDQLGCKPRIAQQPCLGAQRGQLATQIGHVKRDIAHMAPAAARAVQKRDPLEREGEREFRFHLQPILPSRHHPSRQTWPAATEHRWVRQNFAIGKTSPAIGLPLA